MIGRLTGKLIEKQPPHLLVDVNGVAYEVEAPMTTIYQLPEVGDDVVLFTHLAVRDDAHLLFGFAERSERSLFRTLIKINGVGAKMALAILSGIGASEFAECVESKNIDRLVKLPGVGKKTAERLIIEMKDKLGDIEGNFSVSTNKVDAPIQSDSPSDEAVSALIGLGYKPQEASRFVMAVAQEGMNSEEIIREALKTSVK